MQTYAPPRDPTAVMGKRIGAYVVDIILAWVVYVVIFLALGDSANTGGFDPCGFSDSPDLCFTVGDNTYFADGGDAAVIILVPVLYWLAVNVLMQGATGQTPGKAIFGLRAIRRDTGEICGFGKAFVRSILWIVDSFPYCFPLVGLITGLSTNGHKRVGDMAAGTAVVGKGDVGTPLDGGAAYDTGQQWAAPVGGYGTAAAPPPPGGYAPPPPQGYAPPPPQGYAAPAAQDFGTPDPAPPAQEWAAPEPAPPAQDFGTPDPAPPAQEWAAPTGPAFGATAPDPVAEPPTIQAPEPPAEETPVVQSNQPPVTSEPQWDAARNTYIQWDPVLAAWMQWDEPAQRWKPIDT